MKDSIKNELVVPFTIIPNDILNDPFLSLKQKGMIAYLISLPKGWVVYKSELENHFTDGRESISNALEDLVKMGFVSKIENKKEKGKFTGFTYTVLPLRNNRNGFTATDNPQLINTNNNNTDKVNLNINEEFNNSSESDKNTISVDATLKTKNNSAHHRIISKFFDEMHYDFVFSPVHAKSVGLLRKNIMALLKKHNRVADDQEVGDFALQLFDKLPSYYLDKDLAVINSKFNEIVLQIKNTTNGKSATRQTARTTEAATRAARFK